VTYNTINHKPTTKTYLQTKTNYNLATSNKTNRPYLKKTTHLKRSSKGKNGKVKRNKAPYRNLKD
jgi:hypothetical protein